MKLLLDESIPRRLGSVFPEEYEALTAQKMGWAGKANGQLLRLAAENGFDAFITADQGIEYQQNPSSLAIPVFILIAHRTRYRDLEPLIPRVVELLRGQPAIGVYRVAV